MCLASPAVSALLTQQPTANRQPTRRALVVQYYDGKLVADDEPLQPPTRDVTLLPPPPDAPPGAVLAPAATAGGKAGGVLMNRELSEDQLYTHVRRVARLMGLDGASGRCVVGCAAPLYSSRPVDRPRMTTIANHHRSYATTTAWWTPTARWTRCRTRA
jgi:hypothetical protein